MPNDAPILRTSNSTSDPANWPAMNVELRALDTVQPDPNNPRKHSDAQVEQVAGSMNEFGWTMPLLVDEHGVIVVGEVRWRAAQRLGWTDGPMATCAGWTPQQVTAYRVADNKLAENSKWDDAGLKLVVQGLGADGFNLPLLGFSEYELTQLLKPPSRAGLTDDDDVPDVQDKAVTANGELWLLGDHRLIVGDSTNVETIERLMQGQLADLCFTSPPYGQQRDYGVGKVSDWDALMQGVFGNIPTKPGAQVLVNLGLIHRDGEWIPYWDSWLNYMHEHGWRRFGWYVWDQGPGMPGEWSGRLAPSHEFIFHLHREPKRANKSVQSKMQGAPTQSPLRQQDGSFSPSKRRVIQSNKIHDSIFRVTRQKGGFGDAGSHPAAFPVALVVEVFDAFAKAGDIVFEPFCGSGTQLIAADKLDVKCYALEIDPVYCDVAIRRWEAFTGKAAVRESDGMTFKGLEDGSARRQTETDPS